MQEYDICFIAAPSDREDAGKLADSIRKYKLPSGTVLPDPSYDYRNIYIDADGGPFDDAATEILKHSRCLLILCSPDTNKDPGISERLKFFKEQKQDETVIAVILRGEPKEIFPEGFVEKKTVQYILPDMTIAERVDTIEPIASDLRAENLAQWKERLRYETVRIVASVLGLHPDDLEQRHRRRHRRAVMAVVSVIAAVSLFATALFLYLGYVARREGDIARRQTELSVEIARRTMQELPEAFAGEDEALVYIDEAIAKARVELEEIGLSDLLDEQSGEKGGQDV